MVGLNRRERQFFAIDRGRFDLEFERVQHQLMDRTPHGQLHRFASCECKIVEVRNDADCVFRRDYFFRKFSGRLVEVKRFFHSGDAGNDSEE